MVNTLWGLLSPNKNKLLIMNVERASRDRRQITFFSRVKNN